jgi:hypothetical protein
MYPTRERWRELCEQAAKEQDPSRLLSLIKQIVQLLDEKEPGPTKKPAASVTETKRKPDEA